MKKTIKVTMFNDFTLTYQNNQIKFDTIATKQLSNLLQLLIYHKHGMSKDDLISELWENNANPANSLKYSIFRLRSTLDKIDCFSGLDLITTTNSGYIFGANFTVVSDFSVIDDCFHVLCDDTASKQEKIKHAQQIIQLYKGPFHTNEASLWGIQTRSYYQSIYERAFTIVCEDAIKNKKGHTLLPIIQQVIKTDKFFDTAYVYYMQVLIELGQYHKADKLYEQIYTLYTEELNVPVSPKVKAVYQVISSQKDKIVDTASLKKKLMEDIQQSSALYCDYTTFKYIYQASLHNARRDNKSIFLLIFEIKPQKKDIKIAPMIEKLKKIMCTLLRSGDVLSIINNAQIIALLPCVSLENGYSIVHRITTAFYKSFTSDTVRLNYYLSTLNEFNEEETQPQ